MKVEVKKISYTPDQHDDEGELKKEAFFAVQLQIPNTPEIKELLVDLMLLGDAEFDMELSPAQGVLPGIKEGVQKLNELGVTEVKRGG